jgi:hypothetical protein
MKRLIIAIASLLYFAIPAAASVAKEPAEVRAHGGRSVAAHLSKSRKTQARIQTDDPYWQPCDYFSNYGENGCGD